MKGASDKNWVVTAPGDENRLEAFIVGDGFSPHRHDTYAIGVTLNGVQTFDYRGATRHSTPGQVFVLYPDELHDGRSCNKEGFLYRTIYVEPADIQKALGGKPLPFIASGVSPDPRLYEAVTALLCDHQRTLDSFEYESALCALAEALVITAGGPCAETLSNYDAAETARCYIIENIYAAISMQDLERETGQDRWRLSRDFRLFFGVSPYQYLIRRRLECSLEQLRRGSQIADVALACQFSDQSHFTRQFRKTYGITPKRWLLALANGAPPARTNIL